VAITPATSTSGPRHLTRPSVLLADLCAATGDPSLLDEALAVQRQAVLIPPETSPERPSYLNNLSLRLSDLSAVTGDRALLDEARGLVAGVVGSGPWERAVLARTRGI